MIEPLRNNNDNNDNNNNNILRDILPLCRDIVSDRIDGKIISNSMASSRLALPCPSPRMDESLSTRPPPIEQDEKDEKFHFDVPLKPAWFNIGPLFRRFRRSIKPGRYSRKRLHPILDLKGKKNLHRRQIRFSYSLCPYFKDTLYVFLCTSENVEGGLFAGAIRVVEEREGLLIAVTPMIGRDNRGGGFILHGLHRFRDIRECRTINDRTSVALVKRQFLLSLETKRARRRGEKEGRDEEDETGTPEIITAKVEDE